jgi:hypothetical protein
MRIEEMNRKLPVLAAFTHAVRSVRTNMQFAVRISWPVYALLIPLLVGGNILIMLLSGGNPQSSPGTMSSITMLMAFVSLIAFSIIAVRWHRYILRDELPAGNSALSLEPEVWRYVLSVLLIGVIGFALLVVAALVSSILSGGSADISPRMIGLFAACLPFVGLALMRLSVRLPAVALGRSDFSLANAWNATKGNFGALLGMTLLNIAVFLALVVASELVSFGLATIDRTLGMIIGIILQLGINWILTLFNSSVLTSLYGFFVENRDF